jgi:hypothetical protein
VGLVGAGNVAQRHAQVLSHFDDVELVGVTDVVPEASRRLADQHATHPFTNLAALLDADLDAVYVCVPPFAHGPAEEAVLAAGLPMFVGYDHLAAATHAECGAHLLRALNGVYESDPVGQEWAEAMANTLLIAKDMMAEAAAAGQRALDEAQVSFIRSAYAGALASGREATAKHPMSKAAKLVNRFARDADEILRFTTDTAIWFSNNQSERDLRPTKLQLKISATWRSLQGLADFAALRSYLSTASKHGEDLLDVLTALFTTGPWLPPDLAPDPS